MSQALHSGFDRMERDPPRSFPSMAPDILDIDALVGAFADALVQERATGHCCTILDQHGRPVVLTHSQQASTMIGKSDSFVTFNIDMHDDQPLVVTISSPEPPDRLRRARLHALAVVFAAHAVPLIEAQEDGADAVPAGSLTPVERHCLRLLVGGLSYLDIGDQLDISASAVGVYLRRGAARLGVSSALEACTIALGRGLLT